MSDYISRTQAIDALRAMQTYKMFAGDNLLLIDQAGAQTELMMLPSAQPVSFSHGHENDLISRQAAIDALRNYLVEKRCPDDGTLTCRLIENEVINKLPSIQPDIIRCKDCEYLCNEDGLRGMCWHINGFGTDVKDKYNSFCSWAERRTDE